MSAYKMLSLSREQLESLHNIMIEAFGVTGYVKKVRRLFLVGQTRVHVDSVEDLGDFAELEVNTNLKSLFILLHSIFLFT